MMKQAVISVVAVAVLSGCSLFRDDPALDLEADIVPVPVQDTGLDGGFISTDGTVVSGYQSQDVYGSGGGYDQGDLRERVVYFDPDSDNVRSEFRSVIAAHGAQLANNPGSRMRVEGHTDERGTREYNLALGERRALAVKRVLQLAGATASQIVVVSMGEEMPLDRGHSDAAWAQNRRAELVYEGQ